MKVHGNRPPEGQDVYLRTQKTQGKDAIEEGQKIQERRTVKDKVELSGRAREIDALKKAINELPDVRTDKVEEIKKAIETGNYRIDPGKILRRLIEEL